MVDPVSVFATAILPIVAVGGVGYLLGSVRDIDTEALNTVIVYTVGVYIAGRGSAGGVRDGLRRVFSVPLVYAVVVALLARWLGLVPPVDSTAMTTLQLVGDSSIPVMLLLVGIQLARTDVGSTLSAVSGAVGLKMVVAPVLGVGVAFAVGFSDPAVARTFVLETAMPSAVTPVILVGEFADGEVAGVPVTEFVSTAIFATTLVSVVTLTAVIAILKTGLVV